METVYLLLGTNMGDRHKNLKDAGDYIAQWIGKIANKSSAYETQPWPGRLNGVIRTALKKKESWFLNQALEVKTALSPVEILASIKKTERLMGRTTAYHKWAERIMDIDILFFGTETIDLPDLKIPHPLFHLRRFALMPMNEIAPGLNHPVIKKTVKELLEECDDMLTVSIP
jgi:2-amino-4-hydroxy-6-hydroxymethyldihydropteridine diphosphokinase